MVSHSSDLGERVASLERGEVATAADVTRLEGKMDQALSQLREIQQALAGRRGIERLAGLLLDFVKILCGALAATGVNHFWGLR
jgi:hypothetical protein